MIFFVWVFLLCSDGKSEEIYFGLSCEQRNAIREITIFYYLIDFALGELRGARLKATQIKQV